MKVVGMIAAAIMLYQFASFFVFLQDHGSKREPDVYYRLKMELVAEGQPVSINQVIRCRPFTLGGISVGNNGVLDFEYVPSVMGQKLPSGAGVFVPVARGGACHWAYRTTHNYGDPDPPTGTPLVYWTENFDKHELLMAYFTAASYTTESARVRFVSASIGPATEAEWQEPPITRLADLSTLALPVGQKVWLPMEDRVSQICMGEYRITMPITDLPPRVSRWVNEKFLSQVYCYPIGD